MSISSIAYVRTFDNSFQVLTDIVVKHLR